MGSYAFRSSAVDDDDKSVYDFGSLAIGDAGEDRLVIVGVASRKLESTTTLGVTVGGVSLANVVTSLNTVSHTTFAAIFAGIVPTGTSANVIATFGATMLRAGVAVYSAAGVGAVFNTATAFGADPSTTISTPSSGFAIGLASGDPDTASGWVGLTQDVRTVIEGITLASASRLTISETLSVSMKANAIRVPAMAVATWEFVNIQTRRRRSLGGFGL